MRQIDLSDALAISKDSITRWERGSREPSVGNLMLLSSILDVSIAYLMGETDDPVRRAFITTEENTEDLYAAQNGSRITIYKKESANQQRQASLEDFARTRETSRNVKSLDEHDLNAAEEMLLASLEAIRKERAMRTAQRDGGTMSA